MNTSNREKLLENPYLNMEEPEDDPVSLRLLKIGAGQLVKLLMRTS